jgi:hypothetical protein
VVLVVSCRAISTESLSTMTIGVEHFGQRKQAGWAGKEWRLRVIAAWAGR